MAGQKKVQIKISAEAQEVVSALNSAGKKLTKFGVSAQRMGQSLGSAFNPLMKAVATVSAGLVAAAGAVSGASLHIGGSFEDSMLKVKGVASATREEFEVLSGKARDMAADMPVSAQAVGDAMYSMASAGMSVGEILDSINSVVAISVSQGYELGASADVVMATLSSFGLEAGESARVADVFSNAISSSQLNMEKLAYAMRYAAPVANSLGVSLEQTVAAMQALADAGLQGEQIGTYLRGIMTSIVSPSGEAERRLNELGVATRDAGGSLRNFAEVLRDLKTAGASGEDFVTLFGRELSAAGAILVSAADDLGEFEEGLRNVGRTQELLDEQMKSFVNVVRSLKNAVSENFLVVFDGIGERAKTLATTLGDLARAFADWSGETDAAGKVVTAFFEGFGLAMPSVESFRKALDSVDVEAVAQKFRDLGEGVKALFASFKNIAEKVPWKAIAENLDTITGIIVAGWAAGKVALIAGGVTGLARASRTLADAVKAVAVAEAAAGGTGILSSMAGFAPSMAGIATAGATALAIIAAFPTKLGDSTEELDKMRAALEGDREAFESLPDSVRDFMQSVYDIDAGIEQAERASEAAEKLKSLSSAMGETLGRVFEYYEDESAAAAAVMETFGEDVREYLVLAGTEGVKELLASLQGLGPEAEALAADVIGRVENELKRGAESLDLLNESMGSAVQAIVAAYEDQGKAASRVMRQFGDDIRTYLADAGVDGASRIKEAFADLGEDVSAVMDDVVSRVQEGMTEASQPPKQTESYAGSVGQAVKQAVVEFTAYAADLVNKTRQLKDEFGLSGEEAGEALEERLNAKMEEIADKLAGKFDNPALKTILKDTFANLAEQAGGGFYRNLKGYLDRALGEAEDAAMSLDQRIEALRMNAESENRGEWKSEIVSETPDKTVVQLTNGVTYLFETLQKAKTEVDGMGFESLVRSLGDIKQNVAEAFSPDNLDASGMAADVSRALQSLSTPAEAAGRRIGENLRNGIMNGVNSAVNEAKAALSGITVGVSTAGGSTLTDAMRGEI